RVSAIIDWEWGHFGDPLEDLGNIRVREFWNPSGGLRGLFARYEQRSGIPVDPFRVIYYGVQQNVRGMVGIHEIAAYGDATRPMAWYLAYKSVGDRATAEAMAEGMGIAVERPPLPEEAGEPDPLALGACLTIDRDV